MLFVCDCPTQYGTTIPLTRKNSMNKLPPCQVCHIKTALYRCPRCYTCTCSLACCLVHKNSNINYNTNKNALVSPTNDEEDGRKDVSCSGKRDRTKFCSLKGFSDSQLASDYYFLEDVLRVSERSKRVYNGLVVTGKAESVGVKRSRMNNLVNEIASLSQASSIHPLLQKESDRSIIQVKVPDANDMKQDESLVQYEIRPNRSKNGSIFSGKKQLDYLVQQAKLKGINILRMPSGMQRHLSNTSKINTKKETILWKVELRFHQYHMKQDLLKEKLNSPNVYMLESLVYGSSTLSEELGKHLDTHLKVSTTESCLHLFASSPRNTVLIFLKRLPCSSASPQYFQLSPHATLEDSLRGKTIIEYPTLEVVLEKDREHFPLFIEEVN